MKKLKCLIYFLIAFQSVVFAKDLSNIPSVVIDERIISDLRLIAGGFLSPLDGFMNQEDYQSVLNDMRLKSGKVFPLPIVRTCFPCRKSNRCD